MNQQRDNGTPLTAPLSPKGEREKNRRSRIVLLALLAMIILTVAVLAGLYSRSSGEKMAWLTPAQLTQAAQPGPLAWLKSRLGGISGPFRRLLPKRKKVMIHFKSDILNVSPASAARIDLGAPALTNNAGMRAWILSPDEVASFRRRLHALPDASVVYSPIMATADGIQSRMSVGNTIQVGSSVVPVGLTVDLIPKVAGHSLKFFFGVTDTETNAAASNSLPSIKTNLAISGRATVPADGALVIDGGTAGEKQLWLILEPALINPDGTPVKR